MLGPGDYLGGTGPVVTGRLGLSLQTSIPLELSRWRRIIAVFLSGSTAHQFRAPFV